MTAPLSLPDELKKVLAARPEPSFTRVRNDLWSHSRGDIEWRVALSKDQGWSRAQRRISVGVAIAAPHRMVKGLGPLNEGFGTIGSNLLVVAGLAEPNADPAITIGERAPRLNWRRSAQTTWTLERFRTQVADLIHSAAVPLWRKFDSLDAAAQTLRTEGDEVVRRGLLREEFLQQLIEAVDRVREQE